MLSAGEAVESLVQIGQTAAPTVEEVAWLLEEDTHVVAHLAVEVASGREVFPIDPETRELANKILSAGTNGVRSALATLAPAARRDFATIAGQLRTIYRDPSLSDSARQALTGFLVGGRRMSVIEILQALSEHDEVQASLPAAGVSAGAATYLGVSAATIAASAATVVLGAVAIGGLAYADHRLDQAQAKAAQAQVVRTSSIWQFGPWKL